jgi:hypothetical protein
MNHKNNIVQELFQIMKEELNILERKVDLIEKLKTTEGETLINLRQDNGFKNLARQYHSLNDGDIIASWTRKIPRS